LSDQTIKVKVFRFDPSSDREPRLQEYEVPYREGMSAMGALDHIYDSLDGTLAYYDHAGCSLGICGRCTSRIDGRPALLCQTRVDRDVTLEPLSANRVLRDLVTHRRKARNETGSR
jgi:succinate dehydrogenase/fumarate reductase-like Fe-S protein